MVAGSICLLDEQVSGSHRDLKHLDIIFVEKMADEKGRGDLKAHDLRRGFAFEDGSIAGSPNATVFPRLWPPT
jgi:hypothetical protein